MTPTGITLTVFLRGGQTLVFHDFSSSGMDEHTLHGTYATPQGSADLVIVLANVAGWSIRS